MRTLHVIMPQKHEGIGGADMHVLDLAAQQLTIDDMEVAIAARPSSRFRRLARNSRVTVHNVSGGGTLFAATSLSRILKTYKPDVVHSHGYDADYATQLALLVTPSWRGITIYTQHGIVTDTLTNKLKTRLNYAVYKRADGIIVVSEHLRTVVAPWTPPQVPIRFVPNAVRKGAINNHARRAAREYLGVHTDDPLPIVAFVGRLSREKRPEDALMVLERLGAEGRATTLVVGDGPMRTKLESSAQWTKFLGVLDDPTAFFPGLDGILLLSDTEGTPRVIAEAMAHAAFVVATDVGGCRSMVESSNLATLVECGDVESAYQASCRHLSEESTREMSEPLTIEQMASLVVSLYNQAQSANRRLASP